MITRSIGNWPKNRYDLVHIPWFGSGADHQVHFSLYAIKEVPELGDVQLVVLAPPCGVDEDQIAIPQLGYALLELSRAVGHVQGKTNNLRIGL